MTTKIWIAHRGNLTGPNINRENSIYVFQEAIDKGFHIELDVWYQNHHFWLGHNKPISAINPDFLKNQHAWCHAKSLDSLNALLDIEAHCFWHQEDDMVLTSKGYIWALPSDLDIPPQPRTILVMPEKSPHLLGPLITPDQKSPILTKYIGVCSDYISILRDRLDDSKP